MHQPLQSADERDLRAQAFRLVTDQTMMECKKAAVWFERDCDAIERLRDERACNFGKLVTPRRPWSVVPLLSALDTYLLRKAGIEFCREREQEAALMAADLAVPLRKRATLLRTYVATSADGALLAAVRFERDDEAVAYLLGPHWSGARLKDGP